MRILAIETSCDETAISILEVKGVKRPVFNMLSSVVSSQVKIHAKWGGVVPSLAKREHQKNLVPVLTKTLKEARLLNPKLQIPNSKQIQNSKFKIIKTALERESELLEKTEKFLKKYQIPKIDLIAVVNGPGLEPALWVGINFAKALSLAWDKPLLPINHMEGHLFSVFLQKNREENFQFSIFNFQFPAIALLVSGGHTQLILVRNWLKYEILGQTRDDAAGEAFDKVAKMLGLGYPGGPAIAKQASQWNFQFPISNFQKNYKLQIPNIKLPRPMINTKNYDFSFSGLKTAVLYKIKEFPKLTPKIKAGICHEFQQAVIDVLISKTIKATKEYRAKTIILGGGVAANKELRSQFKKTALKNDREYVLFFPEVKYAGDNAAMVALAAYFRWFTLSSSNGNKKKRPVLNLSNGRTLKADGNLKIA